MPTPIKWDEVEVEQPTSPIPSQSLPTYQDLGFVPTEDLVHELGKRGYMAAPYNMSTVYPSTTPSVFYPPAPTTATITTYSTLLGGIGASVKPK